MDCRNNNEHKNININDCTLSYISDEIELPVDFPKPYPIDNKIQFLTKVREVFNPPALELIEREIRASRKFFPDDSYEGGKRCFYIQDQVFPYEVRFKNGEVQGDSITSPQFTEQTKNIQLTLTMAMESLAKALNWTNTTHKISCHAVDYHFTKGSKEPLTWHNDTFFSSPSEVIPSEHSFIILLSNPNDKDTGWKGGDLMYTKGRDFNMESADSETWMKFGALRDKTQRALYNEPNSPVWQMNPSLNDGILFGNKGMNHKVTAMEPLGENGRRLILTLFDYGEVKEASQGMNNSFEQITNSAVIEVENRS